jgi:photosystem II stability/assembly factor-like uncharacterized protein
MGLVAGTSSPLLLRAQSPAPTQISTPSVKLDGDALIGLPIRNIGPAVMSGRIAAIEGFMDRERLTLLVGSASGGVWKSANGGTTWKPIFDKHTMSIGAICVDPSNPKNLWVGTGESWVRNSVSVGDGVYRSTDGGDNWTRMGLPDSERISAIQVDPTDSNTVYVAAMGHLWNSGGERGLYKTIDGGKSWKRILFSNEDSGCASVTLDPKNPKTLFATLWQHRRKPWTFESGGPGSGLFKSTDGGETWIKLNGDAKRGLPMGEVGRIAVSIAPSDPRHVYAVVEAKDGAIFHSSDGGETWERGNAGANIIVRPFYFSSVVVDPKDPLKVYKPGFELGSSDDGGKSFKTLAQGAVHSDHHALFVHPQNSEVLYLGTDGGVYVSEDRGNKWRMVTNLPVGQFYHVSVDQARPYHVFGGLQDNNCWMGSSELNLANKHWTELAGGDGFWTFPDPSDERFVYAESQGGMLTRVDTQTHTARLIKPEETAGEAKYRWNWNTPLHLSPNHKGLLYMGSQYLFRTKDHGASWERISPDLTTNDPKKQQQEDSGGLTVDNSSAETHCTIYTVAESPKNAKVLWAGTDDGNLQITRDSGKTWTNVASNVTGLPKGTWVSWVETSPYAEGTAYAAFDRHTVGDMKTYVYRTEDFGQTWTALSTSDLKGYAHVIKQDPVNPRLLYLGTESGLFISLDAGHSWVPFKGNNFPSVAVRDIVIHPREHDLVIATHGRGIWIIDDLTALRALTPNTLDQDIALLPSAPAVALDRRGDVSWEGDSTYVGAFRPFGIPIAYWQKKRHFIGELKVEILDAQGRVIDTLPGDMRRGFSRTYWTRHLKAPRTAATTNHLEGALYVGPEVLEGTYQVRLTKNKTVVTAPLVLLPDPASTYTRKDREAKFAASMDLFNLAEGVTFRTVQAQELKEAALARAAQAGADLRARLESFAKDVEAQRASFVATKEGNGALTGEERLWEKVALHYRAVVFQSGAPTPTQLARTQALRKDLETASATWEAMAAKGLSALNSELKSAGLETLSLLNREAWDQRTFQK